VDPAAEKFIHDDYANMLCTRAYRGKWTSTSLLSIEIKSIYLYWKLFDLIVYEKQLL